MTIVLNVLTLVFLLIALYYNLKENKQFKQDKHNAYLLLMENIQYKDELSDTQLKLLVAINELKEENAKLKEDLNILSRYLLNDHNKINVMKFATGSTVTFRDDAYAKLTEDEKKELRENGTIITNDYEFFLKENEQLKQDIKTLVQVIEVGFNSELIITQTEKDDQTTQLNLKMNQDTLTEEAFRIVTKYSSGMSEGENKQ